MTGGSCRDGQLWGLLAANWQKWEVHFAAIMRANGCRRGPEGRRVLGGRMYATIGGNLCPAPCASGECLITFTHGGRVYKGGQWMDAAERDDCRTVMGFDKLDCFPGSRPALTCQRSNGDSLLATQQSSPWSPHWINLTGHQWPPPRFMRTARVYSKRTWSHRSYI